MPVRAAGQTPTGPLSLRQVPQGGQAPGADQPDPVLAQAQVRLQPEGLLVPADPLRRQEVQPPGPE